MTENRKFENVCFSTETLDEEYYNCEFIACDFTEMDLHGADFEGCSFRGCNFTMTRLKGLFAEISFSDCKMTGADFTCLNRFSHDLSIDNSQLDYANFTSVKLKEIKFSNCRLYESSFDDAGIPGSIFDNCDLERTSFQGTDLEGVDFSTAYNFSINPSNCKLKKAVFSRYGLEGLVDYLNIVIK